MMRGLILFILFQVFFAHAMFSYGQKHFVTFETTNNRFDVCQGKTFGVIANLQISKYQDISWSADDAVIKKSNKEIATINTSNPGDKKIKFTVIVDSLTRLDTVFNVRVHPKTVVKLAFLKNELVLADIDSELIGSYKWFYNDKIIDNNPGKVIKSPKPGSYKIIVNDINGCSYASEIVEVK